MLRLRPRNSISPAMPRFVARLSDPRSSVSHLPAESTCYQRRTRAEGPYPLELSGRRLCAIVRILHAQAGWARYDIAPAISSGIHCVPLRRADDSWRTLRRPSRPSAALRCGTGL